MKTISSNPYGSQRVRVNYKWMLWEVTRCMLTHGIALIIWLVRHILQICIYQQILPIQCYDRYSYISGHNGAQDLSVTRCWSELRLIFCWHYFNSQNVTGWRGLALRLVCKTDTNQLYFHMNIFYYMLKSNLKKKKLVAKNLTMTYPWLYMVKYIIVQL